MKSFASSTGAGVVVAEVISDAEAGAARTPAAPAEAAARVYSGNRRGDGTTFVSVNGRTLDPRPNFRKQAVTTFDWGYDGRGGPAQLSLAILADHFGDDERARRHYEDFTRRVIRDLPEDNWSLTGAEIDAVCPEGAG